MSFFLDIFIKDFRYIYIHINIYVSFFFQIFIRDSRYILICIHISIYMYTCVFSFSKLHQRFCKMGTHFFNITRVGINYLLIISSIHVLVLKQCVQCKYFRSENVSNTSISLDICFKLVFA
jgi:hypothetical protein